MPGASRSSGLAPCWRRSSSDIDKRDDRILMESVKDSEARPHRKRARRAGEFTVIVGISQRANLRAVKTSVRLPRANVERWVFIGLRCGVEGITVA